MAAGSVGLAEDTGGFAVRNTNDLAAGAARVAEESRTYYLLGYSPPDGKGPRDWRKLKVEVHRPGLEVRARKGYALRTLAEIAAAAEGKPEPKAEPARRARPRAPEGRDGSRSLAGRPPRRPSPASAHRARTRFPFAPWPTRSTGGRRDGTDRPHRGGGHQGASPTWAGKSGRAWC